MTDGWTDGWKQGHTLEWTQQQTGAGTDGGADLLGVNGRRNGRTVEQIGGREDGPTKRVPSFIYHEMRRLLIKLRIHKGNDTGTTLLINIYTY